MASTFNLAITNNSPFIVILIRATLINSLKKKKKNKQCRNVNQQHKPKETIKNTTDQAFPLQKLHPIS